MHRLTTMLVLSGLVAGAAGQNAGAPLTVYKTIPLGKVEGRMDHMAVDVAGQRVFVAALGNNTVEVIDLRTGKAIRSISGFAEPQGIAYVPDLDRIFVANGADGSCRLIDGTSFETIGSVNLGEDADNVRYDPEAKRVYVGYGGGALAVLDAKTGTKLAEIKLGGHPESFRLEKSGPRIFVNVPQANQVAVVDREKQVVIETWQLKEAKANFPMMLDEATHRLFVGCRNPARLLVFDTAAAGGRLVACTAISGDTDDLFFDAQNSLVYVSCGQGLITVIKQAGPDAYAAVDSIRTATGARTSLFVPELKLLCLAVPRRADRSAEIMLFKTK